MTEPDVLKEEILEQELDDDLRPDRKDGQPDPWHGLDDFEDEDVPSRG